MVSITTSAQKLGDAVRVANEKLKGYRANRVRFLREYAGPYYTHPGAAAGASAAGPQPINLLFSTVSIIVPNLSSGKPRAQVRASQLGAREFAETFALALNVLFDEIDLAKTLRRAVIDALFGVGIVKTGLCAGRALEDLAEPAGYLHDLGQPFADAVDLDDYVIDASARDREHAAFEGNRYRLPLDYVLESGLFRKDVAERLTPTHAETDGDRAADLSAGAVLGDQADDLLRYVELYDLWLPHENVVVTLPAGDAGPWQYLREAEWSGPERGPYEMLGFSPVPNNVLPVAPVSVVYDLHVMINKLARKLGRQADRMKTVLAYDGAAVDDAQRIVDANDGEAVKVANVDRIREITFGGADERGYEHLAFLRQYFSEVAGNTDLIGGLRPQSETLGQDEMLWSNASLRIDDMRQHVHAFTRRVVEKLAWYLWTDPLIEMPLIKRRPGGEEVAVTFCTEAREGDFLDYHFDIEPYSLRPDSPSAQYRRLMEWLRHVVLPTASLGGEGGATLDVPRLIEMTARKLDIHAADELYGPAGPAETSPSHT